MGSTARIAGRWGSACCLLLGACGGDDDGSTATTTTTTAVAAATTATPAPLDVTTTQPEGAEVWLAVQGDDGQRTLVELVRVDGSHTYPAATLPIGDQTNPTWSPDGRRVAFAMAGPDGRGDLWVASVDGSAPEQLYDCVGECDFIDDPAWSPDGSTIAVCEVHSVASGHRGSLVAVDAATGVGAVLMRFRPRDVCAGPAWSPDGASLVLEVVHLPDSALDSEPIGLTLSRIDLPAQPLTARALTDPALFAATAVWSPDGTQIAYAARPTPTSPATEIFVIDPDGASPRQVTHLAVDGAAVAEPEFTADGGALLVVVDSPTGEQLVQVAVDSGDATVLDVDCPCRHPRLMPGGPGVPS